MHWFFYFLIGVFIFGWSYLFFAYGLAFILPEKKVSNASVSGLLVRNQVWGGEINIVGDVVTTPGTKITINPGTIVKIQPLGDRFNFHFWPWQLKSGINTGISSHGVNTNEPFLDEKQKIQVQLSTLEAIGTREQPIYFRSAADHPSPYDINLISVKHGIIASTMLSHYRRLEVSGDVSIRDSVLREVGECAICSRYGKPTIVNNIFEQALRQSVWIQNGSPRIADNLFLNLSGQGIVVDPGRIGSPVILNNVFEMPGKDALVLLTGLEVNPGEVQFNKFSGSSTIKIACDSQIKLSQNSILGAVSFIGSGCGGEYTFGPNFWGINDVKTILHERILNKDREFTIKIPIVLTVPPMGVGRRQ
jgi:hypothetical protein